MDDPLLRMLALCKLIRPRSRYKGEYKRVNSEPARTVRCVHRTYTLGGLVPFLGRLRKKLSPRPEEAEAAHRYELLSLWLADGSGASLRGALHGLVNMYLQLSLAVTMAM